MSVFDDDIAENYPDDEGWMFTKPVEIQCPLCGVHHEVGVDHECEVKPLWSWVTLLLVIFSGTLSVWAIVWVMDWVEGRR